MLFTFSPDAYDPAQAPTFADPDADFLLAGSGNLFNGIRVAGKNSPYGRAIYGADRNNLQPRIGAAWDPGGCGRPVRARRLRHVLRPDAGRNVRSECAGESFPFTDPFRTDVFVGNASLSNPARSGTGASRPSRVPDTRIRATRQATSSWRLDGSTGTSGVQRRLYSRGMIDVGLRRRSRGDHLPRFVDINQPQAAESGRRAAEPGATVPGLRRDRHARDDRQEPVSRARDQLSS